MIFAYICGIIFMTLFLLISSKYKKAKRKRINRKENRLYFVYGAAMFIADRLPKKILFENTKIDKEIKELTVKENIRKEKYIYFVKKIAVAIVIVYAGMLIGVALCLTENSAMKEMTRLNRNNTRTQYHFIAKDTKGREEKILIDVSEKKRTQKENKEVIEKSKAELIKKILGKNPSLEKINRPLQLVNNFGKEGINVNWSISDTNILKYDGSIGEHVPKEGKIISITATLQLDKVVENYTFSAKVYPELKEENLQQYIQKYVDDNELSNDMVKIPNKVKGKTYRYFEKNTRYAGWILPGTFILAIIIFFIKDRDLHQAVMKREKQMLKDYPDIVSKLLIYFGAGLSIKSSFERIIIEYKTQKAKKSQYFRYAYEEIDVLTTKINSGISESKAINEFGNRCGVHCYLKFSNILEQNLKRGTKDMIYALKTEVDSAVNERKNNALKGGSEISTKLLGPMVIMLIISIVIIMVPAFMTINF